MGSSAKQSTATTTNNHTSNSVYQADNSVTTQIDHSATVRDGTQILDSIIVDPSDEVMIAAMSELRAGFAELTSGSNANLHALADIGRELMSFIDNGQAQISDTAYKTLKEGVRTLDAALEQGALIVDFAGDATQHTFDLAGSVTSDSAAIASDALDVLAEVKTGQHLDTVKSLGVIIGLVTLGTIVLMQGDRA